MDLHLQHRKATVAQARAVLANPVEAVQIDVDELRHQWLHPIFDEIFTSARAVGADEVGSADALTSCAHRVAQLEVWTTTSTALRPLVTVTRLAQQAGVEMVRVFYVVLDALEMEDSLRARTHEDAMSAAFERLGAVLAELDGLAELAASAEEGGDPAGALLGWSLASFGGDFALMVESGRALLAARLGADVGDDAALSALVIDSIVRVVGDIETFWSLCKSQSEVIANALDPQVVLELPQFQADVGDYSHDLWFDALRAGRRGDPATGREEVDDLLHLGHRTLESAVRPLLAACLAFTNPRSSYDELRGRDVGDLIGRARNARWSIVDHLPTDIRHAKAHNDFSVDDDVVRLSPQRKGANARELRIDQLRDEVLGTVECCLATHLAVLVLGASSGIELNVLANIPGPLLTEQLLRALGWKEVHASENDALMEVSAAVSLPVPLTALAMITVFAAPSVGTLDLTLRSETTGATCRARLDVLAWRAFSSESDAHLKLANFIRLCVGSHRDGQPILSPAHAAKWALFTALESAAAHTTTSYAEIMRRVKICRRMADDLGLASTRLRLDELMAWMRNRKLGLSEDDTPIDRLVGDASVDVPRLPEVLFDPS